MECLGKAGLKIKRNKCEFNRKFLGYLGHQIGCGRVAVPEYRVSTMVSLGSQSQKNNSGRFLVALDTI